MCDSLTSAQREELKGAFDVFDRDGSGRISERELGNLLRDLNFKVNDHQLKQLVRQMDVDQSGEIEFNEFCRAIADTYFRNYSHEELHAIFRQVDQDNSGYIQVNELQTLMNKLGHQLTQSQMKKLVESLDTSGDGQISFEEFVRLVE